MANRVLVVFVITLLVIGAAEAQMTMLWEKKSNASTLPSWFTAGNNNVRCLAYGNGSLYLVERNSSGNPWVRIVDPSTGADIDTLKKNAQVSGGTFALNDVEVSADGVIFAANLTTNPSTSAFKVYKWTSNSATAQLAFSYNGLTTRMGDYITVVGSVSDNSVVIYAPSAASSTIVKFTTTDNGATWSSSTVTVSDVAMGNGPCVAPEGAGSSTFYVKSSGQSIKEYNSSGTLQATLPGGVISTGNVSLKYLQSGSDKFLLTMKFGAATTAPMDNKANIANITPGTASATFYDSTFYLGTYNNAANGGDVAFKNNGNGTFDIFTVSPGNGFGAYRTTAAPLPVQFASMTARATAAGAEIVWATASEVDNAGFDIERREVGSRNTEYAKVGFVAGAGTSTSPREYSYTDAPAPGRYAYRLKQIDRDGSSSYYGEAEVVVGAAPMAFTLGEAYPNPFNPSTTLEFTVPEDGQASLKVYNMLGEEVASLFNGMAKAGFVNRVTFDATDLTTGIYVYRLQTSAGVAAKRMMLVK